MTTTIRGNSGWELGLEEVFELKTEIGVLITRVITRHILNPPFYNGHKYETTILFQQPPLPVVVCHQRFGYQEREKAIKEHKAIIEMLKNGTYMLIPETYELKLGD